MILPQSPTKAPKCRQKAANYRGMQVCALFRLGIHHCKSVKLINLLTCTRWPVLFASPRDAPATYNFLHYGSIVFVSLELPGEGSVSRRNSRLSQPETVSSFETVGSIVSQPLEFRLGGSQLPGSNGIGKSAGLMRAIAERLVCGVPTTAEPNGGPTSQAKGFSLGIKNFEIAFHADGSIVIDSNFRGHHFFLLDNRKYAHTAVQRQAQMRSAPARPGRFSSRHSNLRRRISILERTDQPRRTTQGCRPSG